MTQREIRFAAILVGAVLLAGLLLGYVVGMLTRGDSVATQAPPAGEVAAFAAPPGETVANPSGGELPGYSDVYVNDYYDLLSSAAETRIRTDLIELYDQTGIEMTVLTIQDMSLYGHYGSLESFATALFNAWGIGNATRNDGVLILVSRFDRKMRIELGAGYDPSYDARMQRVIDEAFLPSFRRDAYEQGIERGVGETVYELVGVYPGQFDNGPVRQGWSWIFRQIAALGDWALALLAPPLAGFAFWLRRYIRRRPRPCTSCDTLMIRAGEEADDEHLDGGQRLEEYLKSVDYDVWHCPSCGDMTINRYSNWFSSYGACPRCDYKTMSTTSTVLQAATKSSTGRKRVDYHCQHCQHKASETRTIPKVSSSSGSGSSRSSFGGGSSSGGGASGSW